MVNQGTHGKARILDTLHRMRLGRCYTGLDNSSQAANDFSMRSPNTATTRAAETIIAAARRLLTRRTPILIALDGPSGSGKSTLAGMVAEALNATVVPSDDFFAAEITDAEWEMRSPRDRAAGALDWRRLRSEALEPLLAGMSAQWHAFDFEAGVRVVGTYAMRTDFTKRHPSAVIVLDGTYSARLELADLIDLAVLVDAPVQLRQARLRGTRGRELPGGLA